MFNPINKNSKGDNNSISSLSFIWNVILKNGSQINQFNEDGTENRFQLVKDKFNDLRYFNLTNHKGKLFTVDLMNGSIGYNYLPLSYIESKENKKNIRLIFFRRHQVTLGISDLKENSHSIMYHLGYQYLDKNNCNRKIIIKIDKNGNWILEG